MNFFPSRAAPYSQAVTHVTQRSWAFSALPVSADYDSSMDNGAPITVTLDPRLREWAEHLVATGKAQSVSDLINEALSERYTQYRNDLAYVRERASHADQDRVSRMREHIDAQASSLGLNDE